MTPRWLRKTPRERFWEKVFRPPDTDSSPIAGECWIWRGNCHLHDRYGIFGLDGRTWYAHRLAYTWEIGPVPDGLVLDHLCRTKLCVRPDHLEPVTSRENIRRFNFGRSSRRYAATRSLWEGKDQ